MRLGSSAVRQSHGSKPEALVLPWSQMYVCEIVTIPYKRPVPTRLQETYIMRNPSRHESLYVFWKL